MSESELSEPGFRRIDEMNGIKKPAVLFCWFYIIIFRDLNVVSISGVHPKSQSSGQIPVQTSLMMVMVLNSSQSFRGNGFFFSGRLALCPIE
jgi:hypothetical protein